MNVVEGVWHYLRAQDDLMELLGSDDGVPYLFQDDLILPEHYLENSQMCAVVIAYQGEWQNPPEFNTVQFPRIIIDIWADPDRHPDHSPVSTTSARDKIQAILDVLEDDLHRVGGIDERWGTVRVLGSQRLMMYRYRARGQEFQGVEDGNGLALSSIYFGLTTS